MKRNESVLVYAVTGLLLVILSVALVFGDQPAEAGKRGELVGSLGGDKTADGSVPGPAGAAHKPTGESKEQGPDESAGKPVLPGVDTALFGDDESKSVPDPAGDGTAEQGPDGPKAPGSAAVGDETEVGASPDPVATPEQVKPVALVAKSPAARLEKALGSSRRMGNYRVVLASRGARLKQVVQRWCGGLDHLGTVETLNESLVDSVLTADQEVIVPWVDAETLLAADSVRRVEHAKIEKAKGELYTLRGGDSLWKVALDRGVATNLVPAWLVRFKQLNPRISDVSVLVEGQKIRLPAKTP